MQLLLQGGGLQIRSFDSPDALTADVKTNNPARPCSGAPRIIPNVTGRGMWDHVTLRSSAILCEEDDD